LIKRKIDKGKGTMPEAEVHAEMHIHRMSKITQVQDVLGDLNLGTGFIAKCLDEYDDDVAQVIDNLLVDSLPAHLASADRHEALYVLYKVCKNIHDIETNPFARSISEPQKQHDLVPRSTPPSQLPQRRNAFDDDEFDKLTMDVSKVSFGKRPEKNADQLLQEKTSATGKAAILSALAAFDSDDDERDDTYDAADVGGTVDSSNQEADAMIEGNEETLFRAYQTNPAVFSRDAEVRRGPQRAKLRLDTGMADEALEGWAIMLKRSPQQQRKLEEKFAFKGEQLKLDRSSWKASPAGSGMEESDTDGPGRGGARGGRGRGRGRGGRGRGGGNVDGPTGEKGTESARRHKEANKGARANHNRRDARARKVARGGFPG
jgi:activating signal cointegrator complex subunit 2